MPDVDGFQAWLFVNRGGMSMSFRLYVPPEYMTGRSYPLVVWLHGGGGIGDDNTGQIMGDQINGTRFWTSPAMRASQPALVLVPQASGGWADSLPTPHLSLANVVPNIIAQLRGQFAIDSTRIYLTGQSLGGAGVWWLIARRPELFAAALILCPSYALEPGEIPKPRAPIPTWIAYGSQDAPIILTSAQTMIDAMTAAGGSPRVTNYRDAGHDVWLRVFNEPDLAAWLFAKRR